MKRTIMRVARQFIWKLRYVLYRYYRGIDLDETVRVGSSVKSGQPRTLNPEKVEHPIR
ncbi:MAG: hypothetical protein ABFD63_10290 [Smithella sp.]